MEILPPQLLAPIRQPSRKMLICLRHADNRLSEPQRDGALPGIEPSTPGMRVGRADHHPVVYTMTVKLTQTFLALNSVNCVYVSLNTKQIHEYLK